MFKEQWTEIAFQVQRDEESGFPVASWDAPHGSGGITTQGDDLRDLQLQIMEALSVHFDGEKFPRRIHLHLVTGDTCSGEAKS